MSEASQTTEQQQQYLIHHRYSRVGVPEWLARTTRIAFDAYWSSQC